MDPPLVLPVHCVKAGPASDSRVVPRAGLKKRMVLEFEGVEKLVRFYRVDLLMMGSNLKSDPGTSLPTSLRGS